MNLKRKLTEGVGGWLQFEYHCNRSGLFSEKYLSVPIGQILNSITAERVIAEFKHPVLANVKDGPGRRPEVDFVVCSPYPEIKYAVEAKWIGKTKVTMDRILWDLIRLELIASNSEAECFFLLGGKKGDLDRLFKTKDFLGDTTYKHRQPVLKHENNSRSRLDLVPTQPYRISLFRKIFRDFQEFDMPQILYSIRSNPFPFECKSNNYQVYCWRILSALNRTTFKPGNSKHYKT